MGRGGAPARERSFVSLVASGLKVSHLALAMGGYYLCSQAEWFPTDILGSQHCKANLKIMFCYEFYIFHIFISIFKCLLFFQT